MNAKVLLSVMAATAVIFATSQPTLAQGVLKNIKKAAETTVKKTAETTKEQTKETAVTKTTESASEQALSPQTTTPQSLKPSAAAIAADPKASDNTVPNGYTRSYAQIRAAYEQLPDNVYLKPYYHPNLANYYCLENPVTDRFFLGSLYTIFQAQMPFIVLRDNLKYEHKNGFLGRFMTVGFMCSNFITDTIPEGNKKVYPQAVLECTGLMPFGVHAVFAYCARFAADPEGYFPFEYFCEAIVGCGNVSDARWNSGSNRDPGTGDDVLLSDGTKSKLVVTPFSKVSSNMIDEVSRLYDIAMKVTPIMVIKSGASRYYNNIKKFEKEENYPLTIYNYFLFETAMHFWKFNSKFTKDETFDFLVDEYDKFRALYERTWKNGALISGKPVEMPKTYDRGADFAKKALEVAKSQFSFNVDKVVFTSDKWTEYKEPEWPYRVMHRSTGAALLSKEGDKWIIRYYFYLQKSDEKGGWTQNYSFQAGSDYQPKPVNYKP